MGYYISQIGSNFKIRVENFEKVIKALESFESVRIQGSCGASESKSNGLHDRLHMALSNQGFEVEFSVHVNGEEVEQMDVCDITYIFEKSRDEDKVLAAIAPYVEKGSYIDFQGTPDDIYRYAFNNGKMKRLEGRVTFAPEVEYYLVPVWGDIEPETRGPYDSEEERDRAAREIRAQDIEDNGYDDRSGLYTLTIKDGKPEIDGYSGGFFEEDEEEES